MAAIASAPVHLHALHINDRIFRNIPQSANGLSDDAVVCRDFDMPILSRRETCAFKASPDWQYEELGVKRGVLTSATECTESASCRKTYQLERSSLITDLLEILERLITLFPAPPPSYEEVVHDVPPDYSSTDDFARAGVELVWLASLPALCSSAQSAKGAVPWGSTAFPGIDFNGGSGFRTHSGTRRWGEPRGVGWADSGGEDNNDAANGEERDDDGKSGGNGSGDDNNGGAGDDGDDWLDCGGRRSKKRKDKNNNDEEEEKQKEEKEEEKHMKEKQEGEIEKKRREGKEKEEGKKEASANPPDFLTTRKKKKGKVEDPPYPQPLTPPVPTSAFHEINLDDGAPHLDLSFGNFDNPWKTDSSSWNFSGIGNVTTTDAKHNESFNSAKGTKDPEVDLTDNNPWSFRSKKARESSGNLGGGDDAAAGDFSGAWVKTEEENNDSFSVSINTEERTESDKWVEYTSGQEDGPLSANSSTDSRSFKGPEGDMDEEGAQEENRNFDLESPSPEVGQRDSFLPGIPDSKRSPGQDVSKRGEDIHRSAQSDSGYHSGLGTDTESICSFGSMGSSLGLPQYVLEEFVALFGDTLIKKAHAWIEYAVAHHSHEKIERCLNSLLKQYAVQLSLETNHRGAETGSQIVAGAAKLLRRYRPKISRYFRANAISAPATSNSMALRLQELSKHLSLTEKIGLLENSASKTNDLDEGVAVWMPEDADEDDIEEEELFTNLEPIQDFLVSGEPFRTLTAAMRKNFYFDDRAQMDDIAATVMEALSSADAECPNCLVRGHDLETSSHSGSSECRIHRFYCTASFNLNWKLQNFITSQFHGVPPRLGALVTLSGSALYGYATTCLEYVQKTWPHCGTLLLTALQNALDREASGSVHKNQRYSTDDGNVLELKLQFVQGQSVLLTTKGTSEVIVQLAQQISWMSAALNLSPFDDEQIAHCKPILVPVPDTSTSSRERGAAFNITLQFEPLHSSENTCWLPLFSKAVIAHGFPIPERRDETGLEIPIDIMAAVAGVRHAVEYEGGVVMKGFSSMFVPIKRNEDRVQWHLISSNDCDTRLSYQNVLDRCRERALLKEVDLESLSLTRAIVGWCSVVDTILGRNDINYENIDYSGAQDAESSLRLAGGTFGFQQFGVANLDFTLSPKVGKCHFQRSGPYRNIISSAEKTPIVLYDTGERRAWLVPASSVMLHIAQHRNRLEPFMIEGKPVELQIDQSVRETLLKSALISLSDDEQYTFKDMITSIWSLLEFLLDQNVGHDRMPGKTVRGTLRDVLSGFEFKAVVEERSPFRRKQGYIEKTSGGWPALAKDIDALVLFANGFEDIIRPSNTNDGLCHLWRTLPKWKDYLAAGVKSLMDLYNVAGCRLNRTYLTSSHLQWHRGSSILFEPCAMPGSFRCRCNRLQQIVPKSAMGDVVPPGLLEIEGAVIFGRSGTLLETSSATNQSQQNGIYSQPNVSLLSTAACVSLEDSLPSACSDSEPSSRSSDDSDVTPASSITSFVSQIK